MTKCSRYAQQISIIQARSMKFNLVGVKQVFELFELVLTEFHYMSQLALLYNPLVIRGYVRSS